MPAAPRRVPDAASRDRRAGRFQLRDDYQQWTHHPRAQWCGRRRLPGRDVAVKVADTVAHYSGVQLCGAVWTCPVCGPRIRQQRANDIAQALQRWTSRHGTASVALLTLTVPHGKHHRLADVMATVGAGFRSLTAGRFAQQLRADYGLAHHIKGWDVTVNVGDDGNGWHPHLHVLLFLDAPLAAAQLDALRAAVYAKWRATVTARGWDAPTAAHGVHLEVARSRGKLADYVAKVALGDDDTTASTTTTSTDTDTAAAVAPLAFEMARGDLKRAGRAGRSYWQLLADACKPLADADGVLDEAVDRDRDLWREWERATAGVPSLRWSRGLRAAVRLGEELTDDEVVAEEVGGEVVYRFDASTDDWQRVCRLRGGRWAVLRAAEAGGTDAVAQLLHHIRTTGSIPAPPAAPPAAAPAAAPAAPTTTGTVARPALRLAA